jgi:hypothetical protein
MRRLSVLSVAPGFAIVLFSCAAVPALESIPLEAVSETSSNASAGRKRYFECNSLRDTPQAASILIADIDGDGSNDVIFSCPMIARAVCS